MASVGLTPEKPEFPVGGWHVEGQMNECICATALYYLDSDNITDTSLSSRMHTPDDLPTENKLSVGFQAYHWLKQIYGTHFGQEKSTLLAELWQRPDTPGTTPGFPEHLVSGLY